jgi:hypothetical protein
MSTTTKQKSRSKAQRKSDRSRRKGGAAEPAKLEAEPLAKDAGASKSKSKGKAKAAKSKSKSKTKARKKAKKPALTAKTADRHELYQLAVQSPEADVEFLTKTFKRLRGRAARHVREDFCGTGYFLSEWLRAHKENTGEGFDIDPDPVGWGMAHNFDGLDDAFERCTLHLKDVREPSVRTPDIRFAPNFSWMILTERQQLLEYFKGAVADLADDGIFFLDIYGGFESTEEMIDERKIDGKFTYVWDQVSYHPASGAYHCRIHFKFKDGSELRNVYDYKWRLWSLPELVDILKEAGFSQVDSYWEGTDENGVDGNGVFKKSKTGENCPAWVTYVVAMK